ncbi:MAG TPA: nitrate- and nitrite sensing domain-containing protein [Streptosporangiaceae bacterium]
MLCLLGLYAFVVSITLGNAMAAARAKSIRIDVANPVTAFQVQLAAERHLALQLLANPTNTAAQSAFGQQESNTQRALNTLSLAMASPKVTANASGPELQAIATLLTDAKRLSYIRGDVSSIAFTLPATVTAYDSIMDAGYVVLDEAIDQEPNAPLVTQALHVTSLDRALQTAVAESDLLAADIAQRKFPLADRTAFAGLASQRQSLLDTAVPELQPPYKSMVSSALTPALSDSLTALETQITTAPWRTGVPASLTSAPATFMAYTKALGTALAAAAVTLQAQAQHQANTIFLQLILAGGAGLFGIIASIALSLVVGRRLVRQLRQLRESALTLAHEKLPSVISQLRAGQPVDVTEYEPGEISSSNEIDQVQHAFGVVQQTAVQSAVDEARLRRGISDVFRNLAGRSQSLLHRQLTLLDGMERRATEPDELEDLFRIDHLTTRMRRHAEGLIILSGETPARGWRQPVPLVDVLRAAVAEVEDYTRVRVLSRTTAAVAGHAVADIIHLIAELAENATVFSPPNTPVRIQGDVVGRGFAIEIEDRGLGISPQRLAEVNANLANPPQFDLSGSDRLGLFIAGQLAQRHEIKVTLRPSVYGGTTAIVLIPTALVVHADTYEPDPSLPSGQSGSTEAGRLAGRHAALGQPTSRNGTGRSTAEVDPDYAGTSLAIGSTAESTAPADITEPTWAGMPDPVTNGASELGEVVTTEQAASAVSESSAFGAPEPASPDQPEYADGTPEPRRYWTSEPTDNGMPTRTVTGSPVSGADPRITTAELTDQGLPVRVRQASLAPQLRNSGTSRPASFGPSGLRSVASPSGLSPTGGLPSRASLSDGSSDDGAASPPPRGIDVFAAASRPGDAAISPEEARDTVSALQRGWILGRAAAAETSPAPADGESDTADPDQDLDENDGRTD